MELKTFYRWLLLSVWVLIITPPSLAQTPSGYLCSIRNDSLLTSKIYEFDIYLENTDMVNIFELAIFQAGIIINSSIVNGGTITPTIISGSSQLVLVQRPTSVSFSSNCIRLAPKAGPGMGAGTIIPTSSPGIRVARIRLTNSVDFGQFTPDFTFNFTATPYNTIVSSYDRTSTLNVNITSNNFHTVASMFNPVMNGSLSIYNVTGGGISPAVVGLNGSQTGGVNYLLYKNGNPQGSSVDGTGSSLAFGSQTNGTYTVKAHRKSTYMYGNMDGSAVVTSALPVAFVVTGGGSYCQGTGGLPVGVANSETGVTYTLYKNTVAQTPTVAGTGSVISFGNQSAGTYTVKGTNTGGTTDMNGSAVIIENQLPVISGALNVCAGSTIQLAGSGIPAGTNPWLSATLSVATVNNTGLVTGVSAGTSVITYTNSNGCSKTATVTVNVLPTISGILSVLAGSTTQLIGSGTPATTNPWVSATTTVATVNNTGLVTGLSAGTSVITYTNDNGCCITAIATVSGNPTISIDITENLFAFNSYPNPFRDRLNIKYSLMENSDVRIIIYDIYGKLIITLVNEKQLAGNYSVHWSADSYPQGEYIIKIQAGIYQKASKVILLR